MSTTTSNSKAPASAAAPPSAAEIQRKLSMHAQSPPSHRRKGSLSKSPVIGPVSPSLDLGNEISVLNPSTSYGGLGPQEASSSQSPATAQGSLATQMAQLSVIAERPGGSGEETDDDDDDDFNPMEGRSLEELNNLNDECPSKEGYLYKKGERRKTWKKRWFVLRQTQLSYYKTNKEYKLLRLLPLSEVHCVTPVTLKRHDHAFGIVTPARTYYVQAESAAEADSWVRALNDSKGRLTSGGNNGGAAGQEARRNAPPTISIQRSTPMNIQGTEPRTPPPQGFSGSPSSPSHHQQMTSSDSEDPDSYAPSSPMVGPSSQGQSFASQMAATSSAAGPIANKVIVQGYLMKCGSKRKAWRKRWFVLTPEKLVYAKNHMDLNAGKHHKAKMVPLNAILDAIECKVSKHPGHGLGLGGEKGAGAAISTSTSMPGGSSVVPPGTPTASAMSYSAMQQQPASSQQPAAGGAVPEFQQLPHTFKIVTPKRPLLLCAPSEEEEIKWLSAVRALIARRTASVDSVGGPGTNQFALAQQQPAPPQPPYQAPAAQHGSPSKKSSRREPSASSSGSPPQGDYVITPAQASGIRKDATSLTGAAATAMTA